jgi:MFS family permease
VPSSPEPIRNSMVQRFPVYYGWVILLAGALGMFMTVPGQTIGISIFLDSIIADLGMTRTSVSLLYTIATLAASLGLPFVGRAIDSWGPRIMVVLIAAFFALACGFMGLVDGPVLLFFGFMLLRGLGQGSLAMVSMHVVNLWFVRRRGLAVGLAGVGFMLSFTAFPPVIDYLIQNLGWRSAYVALGGLVAITILPLGAVFFRTRPERFGLEPDGGQHAGQTPASASEPNFTLNEARRTGIFWLYVAAGFFMSMIGTAMAFHHYDILSQNGVVRSVATAAFSTLGIVAASANLLSGALLDRLPYRLFLGIQMGMMIVGMLLIGTVTEIRGVILYGIVNGVMLGSFMPVSASVYAKFFGRKHLGAIKGTVSTILVAASALGPLVFSLGYDLTGSYLPVLIITAVFPLAVLVASPFVRLPTLSENSAD